MTPLLTLYFTCSTKTEAQDSSKVATRGQLKLQVHKFT